MYWLVLYSDLIIAFKYLPSIIPLLAIISTNLLLIVGAIFLMTIGKAYTRLSLLVDDDVRNSELDKVQENNNNSSSSTAGYYLYIVRLYFVDCFHLENDSQTKLMHEDGSSGEDSTSLESGTIVDGLMRMEKRKRRQVERDQGRILIIELVNKNRLHLTKLELDLIFLKSCFIRKIPYVTTAKPSNHSSGKQKGSLYLVKFLFERNHPLTSVAFMRIRQLSSNLPLFLYRVEFQDTGAEQSGIACHVNASIGPIVKCYPALSSEQYTPQPLDSTFNSTKLIWTEMTLFLLLGLNVFTLISLNLLDYSSGYEGDGSAHPESASHLYWTQAIFGSALAATVVGLLDASYRIFTYRRPQYRKVTLHALTLILSFIVIALSVTSTFLTFKHPQIYNFQVLHFWVEAYLIGLLLYGFFTILIAAADVCIFLLCF